MGVHSSACKQAAAHPGSTSECRLLHQQHYTHASWFSCEHTTKNDTEEKTLLNKVVIFVFFAHKKYSRSFITLRLYHWCHMDYFNDVLTTFLGLQRVSFLAVYGGSESSRFLQKYLNLCSEDEWKSYRFGTTWGWVINDWIFICEWTIPLKLHILSKCMYIPTSKAFCNFFMHLKIKLYQAV